MEPDLYTITQALGKYSGDSHYSDVNYRNKLPPLHNLLYTSKSTRQGSIDRYKKEECTMSIKQDEFKYYLISNPTHKVGIFKIMKAFDNTDIASIIILSYMGDNRYFVEWKRIYTTFDENEVDSVIIYDTPKLAFGFLKQNMDLEDLLGYLFKALVDISGNRVDIYEDPRYYIRFDVLTTYNILTSRSSCVKLVKEYAKEFVLDMINDDIRKLVVKDNIPALNLYLYMNANIFNIDKNYYPRIAVLDDVDIYGDVEIEQYISETEDERNAIFDIVKSQINAFT
jgi:hypothetical protein